MSRKIFLFLFIFFLIINNYAKNKFSDEFIELVVPVNIQVEFNKSRITKYDKVNCLEIDYIARYNEKKMDFRITLPIRLISNVDDIQSIVTIKDITSINKSYGMGEILNVAENRGYIYLDENSKKFISSWGSSTSRDILAYFISVEHDIFKNCLIEVINVWPEGLEIPFWVNEKTFNNTVIENSSDFMIYDLLDEMFLTIRIK